ncbi:hypothetical protein NON00_24330, partial [Roseomonas sp. GC11]|uniref:hypothetical protein n=1 Tax=Roseomonas sp. GC11 TaxID=2950546 RepID=UPI00210F157B
MSQHAAGPFLTWHRAALLAGPAMALLLCASLLAHLSAERRDAQEHAARALSGWASMLAEQSGSLLRGVEQALYRLGPLPEAGGGGGALEGATAVEAALAMLEGLAPASTALALAAADGRLVGQTRRAAFYLAGQDTAPLSAAVARFAAGQGAPLAAPVRSTSGPLLPVLRRLRDGRVVLGLLPLRALEAAYGTLALPPGSHVALLDGEGRVMAVHPPRRDWLDLSWPGLPAAAVLQASPRTWSGRLPGGLPRGLPDGHAAGPLAPDSA